LSLKFHLSLLSLKNPRYRLNHLFRLSHMHLMFRLSLMSPHFLNFRLMQMSLKNLMFLKSP
jgi:hypothetical protein